MTHLTILYIYIYINETLIIVAPYECTRGEGGYYGLVVVTQPRPRPQTFHCERDYLKNPEWIASIF